MLSVMILGHDTDDLNGLGSMLKVKDIFVLKSQSVQEALITMAHFRVDLVISKDNQELDDILKGCVLNAVINTPEVVLITDKVNTRQALDQVYHTILDRLRNIASEEDLLSAPAFQWTASDKVNSDNSPEAQETPLFDPECVDDYRL